MPPPHTSAMKMPEAAAVYLPRPSTARLKMAPHMIEVQKPQRIIRPRASGILEALMVTATDSGTKIAAIRSTMATEAITPSIILLLTLEPTDAPTRRPISIQSQYPPIIVPASAGPTQSRPE